MSQANWYIISFIVVIITHTAVLFRWGGRVDTTLKVLKELHQDNSERIKALEETNQHRMSQEIQALRDKIASYEEARR